MDRCTICGCDFGSRSFGGPGICPACDCGIQPIAVQKAEIDRLRAELEAAKKDVWHLKVLLAEARPLVRDYLPELYVKILQAISEDEDEAIDDAREGPAK